MSNKAQGSELNVKQAPGLVINILYIIYALNGMF